MNRLVLRLSVAILLLVMMATVSRSQMFERKTSEKENTSSQSMQNPLLAPSGTTARAVVMDGAVNPKEYIVGPGDVFSVNIWANVPTLLPVTVTPEGSVIIPSIAEVSVSGLTLEEAKVRVLAEVRKRYSAPSYSLTLVTPRSFFVYVRRPSGLETQVVMRATDRVDVALAAAQITAVEEGKLSLQEKSFGSRSLTDTLGNPESSLRDVMIRHKDGTFSHADIGLYFVVRDPRLNPLLRDGDVIIPANRDIANAFFTVYGAVNKEGVVEFRSGDRVSMAIAMAQGLTVAADSGHVVVHRQNGAGTRFEAINIDLRAIAAGRQEDIELRRGDRIVVHEYRDRIYNYKVQVEGEVGYPGYYPITKDSTTLAEVIRLAGGFRATAAVTASRLYRRPLLVQRGLDATVLESFRGVHTSEDTAYANIETRIRLTHEIVPVDFASLSSPGSSSKSVYLRDGDHIIVPKATGTVYIYGTVVRPGHYPYIHGNDLDDYLDEAGGYGEDAAKSDVRIVKADTKQWLDPSETTIEEGDYIWVPKAPYRPATYYVSMISNLFGIVGSVATIVILFTKY